MIKKAYIEAIEKKLERARRSYDIAKNDTIEAEGRMITRYDSTKTETAWLADGYLKEVKELEQCIEKFQTEHIFANIFDTIQVDLISNGEYQKTENYTLIPDDESKVPKYLFSALIGRTVDETVIFTDNRQCIEYHVRKIQKGNHEGVIAINSVVVLEDEYGDIDKYCIINYIGGIQTEVKGETIYFVSKDAPIAQALFGKREKEVITVLLKENITFKIISLEE